MSDAAGEPPELRRVFEDLEAEFEAGLRHEDEQGATEALRAQQGETLLWEYLARRVGWQVVVRAQGRVLHGTLVASYVDFCVLQSESGAPHLVGLGAGVSIGVPAGQRRTLQPAPRRTEPRYRLMLALRELARRREPIIAVLVDGSEVSGTIETVGRDYVEVAEHDPGEPRREVAVHGRRVLPLPTLVLVSPTPDVR